MLQTLLETIPFLIVFGIVALAADRIGRAGTRIHLPFITGFLLTGILTGPRVLGMIDQGAVDGLGFINHIALAVIAFAAGSELYLEEVRSRLRSILKVTLGIVVATFSIGSLAFYLLSGEIPFPVELSRSEIVAVACIVGSILVAQSPSSAIAIVRELRAKGPFTQMVLSVTVIMDVVVIVIFSVCSEIAGVVFSGIDFDLAFAAILGAEIAGSLLAGALLWKLLGGILSLRFGGNVKTVLILLAGWGIFLFSEWLRHASADWWSVEILLEPLLICMVGGLLVTNRSPHRTEFGKLLHDVGPPVYMAFFVLTGASLDIEVLVETWPIAITLFLVRMLTRFIGTFIGGTLAGDPPLHNRVSWLAFITQAGVGIGLAREVAGEFPVWGGDIATLIIAVIVINQIVGPPMFKWAIGLVRESHVRAEHREFDGVRDALIFGSGGGSSLTLARQLIAHDWKARVIIRKSEASSAGMVATDVDIVETEAIDLDFLRQQGAADADAVVTLLSDEENLRICELIYEHFGTETVVVRLHDREYLEKFQELQALIVDPSTAMVSLLEHFVRSPAATSILLGTDPEQDVIEVEVRDPDLDGVSLRNLKLPHDTLVLSVSRDGHTLISHGYTQLKMGDHVTVVGSPEDLDKVLLMFDR